MSSHRPVNFMRIVFGIIACATLVAAPEAVQAQLRKVPPAIPRITQPHGPMPAYIISGLALVMITVLAFRSAHRRKP
ncbi:MAG: hypothetical protein HKL95_11160 [Phycisphaerae bacterium]|nr:hypothetical protein [Phycisphaerae bacterium]